MSGISLIQDVVVTLQPYMNTFVIFFLILFLGFLVGKILGRLTKRILTDIGTDKFMRTVGITFSMERLLSHIVEGIIYIISIMYALRQLGVATIVLQVVLLVIMVVLLLSLLLALKDLLPNFMAGVRLRQHLKKGNTLKAETITGKIERVTLLDTVVLDGKEEVIVPHSLLARQQFKVTRRGPRASN